MTRTGSCEFSLPSSGLLFCQLLYPERTLRGNRGGLDPLYVEQSALCRVYVEQIDPLCIEQIDLLYAERVYLLYVERVYLLYIEQLDRST